MVEASLVSYAELGVLLVGVVIALLQLRDIKQTRQAELFMQLYQGYTSEDINRRQIELLNMDWEDYHDFETKYGSDNNPNNFAKRSSHLQWFNGIGFLVKDNLIDLKMVYKTVGMGALLLWSKYESIIREQRGRYKNPEHSIGFEYLINEIKRIRKQKGHPTEAPETLTRYIPNE